MSQSKRLSNKPGEFDNVPIIDLSPLSHDAAGFDTVARAIDHAYSCVGFAYVVNHGILESTIAGVFRASKAFHALPLELKMEIEINQHHRGFIPINTSTAKTSSIAKVTKPNQSESFMMMHELPEYDPDVLAQRELAGPNQWPVGVPGFCDAVRGYNAALTDLGRRMLTPIAIALGQSKNVFAPHFAEPTTFLRLLFYPPQSKWSAQDVFGSAPHTDYGFMTILCQDQVGGLQVRNIDRQWIDVPYMRGAFVMNVGDMLHRWSNGRFISTPHRVINNTGQARYSCPFFFDPNVNTIVTPFENCMATDQSMRYEPVRYGDYLMTRLRSNHDQHADRDSAQVNQLAE